MFHPPASFPQTASFIAGHFAFSTLRDAYPDAQYLTFLREPFSRLLSLWLFWRQHTDAELAVWGRLGERVRKSRLPLSDFLDDPMLACVTDNITLRMLLWPHPLLPANGFIDPLHDERLLGEASARLDRFDFVDIVENGNLVEGLQTWLDRPLRYSRINETRAIPPEYRTPLHRCLTSDALDLLRSRTRLDTHFWLKIAQRSLPGQDASSLAQTTTLANVARYAPLMA